MKKILVNKLQPTCFWITGLSATGKTTLSEMLVKYLRENGRKVIHLDGDHLRNILSMQSYTREERLSLGMIYSKLCRHLVEQEVDVVIGVIGLFKELHLWNRENIKEYVEIFIDTPMEELIRRDPKGIYKKYHNNELNNIAGLDLKVDFPMKSDIVLRWEKNKNASNMFDELLTKISFLN
jgi:cytidine diphosphoramidate kinase